MPKLSRDDRGRLIDVKHSLVWSDRYPTPISPTDYGREAREKSPYRQIVGQLGRFKLVKPWSFAWVDFDRIYQIAADIFRSIAPYIDEDEYLILPEGRAMYRG